MENRISVIVPVYNVAKELPRCLDSILAQTYPNLEIIAVNDGSSDTSGQVLDRYAAIHPRIRVIHQENGGVTAARLRGVSEAAGDWIGFVDGDDDIEPDMYGRLLDNARKHDADISHCGYRMIFSDGRVHDFHNSGQLLCQDSLTARRELLSGTRIEPGLCNKLFRKNLFSGLSMPEDIKINEDLLMNYHLFSVAKNTIFDDWCPYHYIVRDTSATRKKLNRHRIYDPIRVKEIILEAAPEELQDDARCAWLNTCINTYHVLLTAGREFEADRKNICQKIRGKRTWFLLLGRKRRLMAQMIADAPVLYGPVYGVYSRYLQRSKYS